jgi:hypothetical protein
LLAGALLLIAACQRPQGAELAERAFQRHLSDIPITVSGRVVRLLSDDTRPPPHQRFIIETARGQTLLVLYNLDFGKPIPVRMDDRVTVRGEYIWNRHGGAVHRLHRDPRGRGPAGWVRLERTGKRYP